MFSDSLVPRFRFGSTMFLDQVWRSSMELSEDLFLSACALDPRDCGVGI